jgi:hypothetical protein
MKSFVGGSGFMNKSQLAKYLKKSHHAIPNLVEGLDRIPGGKSDQYFIPDIAEKILEKVRGKAVV